MIELKQVYYRQTKSYIETEIRFTYNNRYGIYTILDFKNGEGVTHTITFNTKTYSSSLFNPENEITDTDFIKAFNNYFNYQIKL